ncbi:MAG: ATP-binding protein [Chloroflexi bacterium]|nr:ATP-binding protein [Chloroflexota bacterium]
MRLLAYPLFEENEQEQRARLLWSISLTIVITSVVILLLIPVVFSEDRLPPVGMTVMVLASAWITMYLTRKGKLMSAAAILPMVLWLVTTIAILNGSGIYHPAIATYFTGTMMVALLISGRWSMAYAVLSAFTAFVIVIASETGGITFSADRVSPIAAWMMFALNLVLLSILIQMAVRNIGQSLQRAQVSEQAIRERNTALEAEIAERKRIETDLRHQRDLLNQLADNSPVGIIRFDETGTIIYCNPVAQEAFGLRTGETLGNQRFFDHDGHPLKNKELPSNIVLETGKEVSNARLATKDDEGNLRYYSVNAAPLLADDGSIEGIVSIQLDISQRVEIEQRLHQFSTFQTLIAGLSQRFINVPIEELDTAIQEALESVGRFVGADRSFIMLFSEDKRWAKLGYEWVAHEVEAFMPTAQVVDTIPFPNLMEKLQALETVILTSDADEDPTRKLSDTLGNYTTLLVPVAHQWNLLGIVGFDAVKEPRTWSADEIMLLRFLSQMFANVQDRRRAEEQAVALAAERRHVKLLKEFISNISHDIKTPLTAINNNLYLLERSEEAEAKSRFAANIRSQIFLLDNTIQDILTMSRLDTLEELSYKPTNVNRLLRELENRLDLIIERKGVHFSLQLARQMPEIMADRDELDRALMQIIQNAITYTQRDGKIVVWTSANNGEVTIGVEDTGIGISDEDLESIFERFFRADRARDTATGGTGLGLAIAKRIVEMHNGRIEVESEVGRGSIFRIKLPLRKAR